MARFSLRLPLQRLFASSGTAVTQPDELSPTVSLVHEYPGRGAALTRVKTIQVVSTAALTPSLVVSLTVPAGGLGIDGPRFFDYAEVIAGDLSHDSATVRNISLFLQDPVGFNTCIGRWTNMAAVLAPGQPSGFEPIFTGAGIASQLVVAAERLTVTRPLIVPGNWNLAFLGNTAGANYSINVSLVCIGHPSVEKGVHG